MSMIDLFYLQIPSLSDFEQYKNKFFQYLPKEEQSDYLQKDFNKARLSSFLGKVLLYRLAKQRINLFDNIKFSYHKQGKPYFKEYPDFHFNISHSSDYVIVAVSNGEVGVDIERFREYNRPLAERFLHPEEFLFLESLDKDKQSFYYTSIWNLKESYVKYTGEGIADTFKDFSIDMKNESVIEIKNNKIPVSFKQIQEIPNYLISICHAKSISTYSIELINIEDLL